MTCRLPAAWSSAGDHFGSPLEMRSSSPLKTAARQVRHRRPAAAAGKIEFAIEGVSAGQRLGITYVETDDDPWFYGWVHAK